MWIAIKHNYMKGFILFSILTILSCRGFTQTVDSSTLTIKGGFQMMNGAVLKEVTELDDVFCQTDTDFEKSLDSDKERSEHFLKEVQKLYAAERRCREEELSSQQIVALRKEEAVPILAALKVWLQENYKQVLPKSPIGKAIAYALPRWDRLSIYTLDSKLQIDNNWVENARRPVALGRKNYMFAGSNEGGKRLALFYSLLESCRKQNINPWKYLTDILNRMPSTKTSQLRNLLPDKWQPEVEV